VISCAAGSDIAGNAANPQAVTEVLSGRKAVANAAWWGFDEEDATEALQAAINSGAKTVIVPNVCDGNYRQRISVISVDGLLVENSVFQNTWGTPPSSCVDLEPDTPDEVLRDIVFRNCLFKDNCGDGIEVFLANMSGDSGEVSVRSDDCRATSRRGSGIRVSKVKDTGPGGVIEFRDCVVENTQGYGIKVQEKSCDRARLRFVNCTAGNAANNRGYGDTWAPIALHPKQMTRFGGIGFVDCLVADERDRPALKVQGSESDVGVFDITGTIAVRNPCGAKAALEGTRLRVRQASMSADLEERHVADGLWEARAALDATQARTSEAEQALRLAQITLENAEIRSPADGVVAQRLAEPGEMVAVGQPILTITEHSGPLSEWIIAKFEETKIRRVKVGQPAEFRVDAYPGRAFRGHVVEVRAATQSQFSLIPAQQSSGSFTKVTQRIPVKIVIDDDGARLSPGMSGVESIDVSGGAAKSDKAAARPMTGRRGSSGVGARRR
jgi:hypothetical protein